MRNLAISCTLCLVTLAAFASEPALQVEYTDYFGEHEHDTPSAVSRVNDHPAKQDGREAQHGSRS